MTELNTNDQTNEEFYKEEVEKDGLSISVNEETDEITFRWDCETHPEWNYLQEVSKEDLIKKMCEYFEVELNKEMQKGEE